MDEPFSEPRPRPLRKSTTSRILRILASVVLLLFVVVGAIRVNEDTPEASFIGAAQLGEFCIFLAAGLTCGGMLVGLAALLQRLGDLHTGMLRMEQFQYELRDSSSKRAEVDRSTHVVSVIEHDSDTIDSPAPLDGLGQEMIRLLEDIRDNSLLSETQRQEKSLRVAEEEFQDAADRLRSLTRKGNFVEARELAERTRRKYPHEEQAQALVERVEESRRQQESNDVSRVVKQVNDLISISAWPRAREVTAGLQERHPDSVEARQLLLRIEREHKIMQDEQRRRMYAEVQRYVTRRRWEEALAATRTFVERFAGSNEAEALQLQIPTLETNAEIEMRQKLEAQIMDLAKHGRYMEAVELAKKVIARFPGSPQADALRGRLDRLQELAHDPEAPPARVRLDD